MLLTEMRDSEMTMLPSCPPAIFSPMEYFVHDGSGTTYEGTKTITVEFNPWFFLLKKKDKEKENRRDCGGVSYSL